jgi:hypothetical protein
MFIVVSGNSNLKFTSFSFQHLWIVTKSLIHEQWIIVHEQLIGWRKITTFIFGQPTISKVCNMLTEEEWWLWIIKLNDTIVWKAMVNWDSRWSHWGMLLWNQVCEVCTSSLVNVIIIHCLSSKLLVEVMNFFYLHKFTLLKIQWKKMLAF